MRENIIIGLIILSIASGILLFNPITRNFIFNYPVQSIIALITLFGFNIFVGPKFKDNKIFRPFAYNRYQTESAVPGLIWMSIILFMAAIMMFIQN